MSGRPPAHPAQDQAAILADLTRVKAIFQLRAITAAMGIHPDRACAPDPKQ
jgi:hypothetical protein